MIPFFILKEIWKFAWLVYSVKISKKYLPQTCSRSARVWWLRSIFSISLQWQKRWRYRHLQDRNRSRVWLNFINNRSRLPLQWLSPVRPNYLSKKSMLGLSTRVTNKQGCMSSNNCIKLIYKLNKQYYGLRPCWFIETTLELGTGINKEALLVIGWHELYLFRMKVWNFSPKNLLPFGFPEIGLQTLNVPFFTLFR